MKQITRQQRWLQWINVDETNNPICPPFGCVEIVGSEVIGSAVLLKGRSATAFERSPNIGPVLAGDVATKFDFQLLDNRQGAIWSHAFNNDVSVNPGEKGLLTFDLPTWAATFRDGTREGLGHLAMGDELTLGNFFSTYIYTHLDSTEFMVGGNPSLSILDTPAVVQVGRPWRLGSVNDASRFDGPLSVTSENGWNVYYDDLDHYQSYADNGDNSIDTLKRNTRTYIGGARTFLRSANGIRGTT
jgi:hypothetical protein